MKRLEAWILALLVVYMVLRGVNEGIAMHLPNLREHPWFWWYHSGRMLEAAALIGATLIWGVSSVRWLFLAGAALVAWEAFEIAYFVARLGQAAPGHENILGLRTVDSLTVVCGIHLARVLLGAALIWKGGKK